MELSKTKTSLYASLGQSSMRKRHGLFTVEGDKGVSDCMGMFSLEALILEKGHSLSFPMDESKMYEVNSYVMKKLSNLTTPSRTLAVFRIPEKRTSLEVDSDKLYIALDGVRDPGNMGTIIRTCHWFGIKKIFASNDCVDIYNPKTIQATMGSLGKVEVVYCELSDLFEAHKEMPVYGLLLDGDDIYAQSLRQNGFIVMGNEGKGISTSIRDMVTHPLCIPPATNEHPESLNVSIATAVTLAIFAAKSH